MSEPMMCPKCGEAMERGFITDNTYGGVFVSGWVRGAPKKSFWRGTKASSDKALPTGSFRCVGCGFLESYARPDLAAD